jgi:hypothetical protein
VTIIKYRGQNYKDLFLKNGRFFQKVEKNFYSEARGGAYTVVRNGLLLLEADVSLILRIKNKECKIFLVKYSGICSGKRDVGVLEYGCNLFCRQAFI